MSRIYKAESFVRQFSLFRNMSACARTVEVDPAKIASYEEVKNVPSNKNVLLVDVREPKELEETGKLPSSINIPLGDVENAFKLPPEEFKSKFGVEKPAKDAQIIFSCRSGGRSGKALVKAESLGFTKAKSYGGGWLEWEKYLKK